MENQENVKSLKVRLEEILEEDLIEVDRSHDIKAARELLKTVTHVTGMVEDTIDDISMRLAKLRASILYSVFGKLPDVEMIEWDKEGGRVRIYCIEPLDGEPLQEIKDEIKAKHQEIDLDKVMTELQVHRGDTLTWRWVC